MDRQGVWVGWSGRPDGTSVLATLDGMSLRCVPLSGLKIERHHDGYCSSTLWPLYHDAIERPEFRRDWCDANRVVNQRFADTVAQVTAGAVVWVHEHARVEWVVSDRVKFE